MTNEQFNAIALYAITRFGVLLVVASLILLLAGCGVGYEFKCIDGKQYTKPLYQDYWEFYSNNECIFDEKSED